MAITRSFYLPFIKVNIVSEMELNYLDEYFNSCTKALTTKIKEFSIHIEEYSKDYRINLETNKISFHIPSTLDEHYTKDLIRLIRLLSENELNLNGYDFLHAALLEVDGVGIGIIGEKFAGKTSTLLLLLKEFPLCKYISNDKVAIKNEAGRLSAMSLPIAMGVRFNTFKQFLSNITETRYNNKNLSEFAGSSKLSENERIFLLPIDVKNLFNHDTAHKREINLFIIPEYNKSKNFSCEKVSYQEGLRVFNSQLLDHITINDLSDKFEGIEFKHEFYNNELPQEIDIYHIVYNEFSLKDVISSVKGIVENQKILEFKK